MAIAMTLREPLLCLGGGADRPADSTEKRNRVDGMMAQGIDNCVDALKKAYEIVSFLGNWELSSRNVFLISSSSAVGCTFPVISVTRETIVCSPGVAPFQL